ncbi:hypothetical protein [Frigidibacter sp. ROC022]|uniref:hypothetical protein n=1 Tax=Frigidibacter sp. ROC022 TaxID=2971796 RepID=UPI00215B4C15|nr:hypothetical protein [Frigidibacter sp. ROC022]MCR8723057.1 hypothetical protein [Frigidibacter sp. ROC022]
MQDHAAASASQADPGDEINTALAELLPRMRSVTLIGWGVVAGLITFGLILVAGIRGMLSGIDANLLQVYAVIAFTCGLLVYLAAGWTRRRHEALVLPILARSAGLSYEQNARYFVESVPQRMLPRGRARRCEDLVDGEVAGRPIAFGEVRIETGGKHSTVQFRGIVARYAHRVPMPPFLIAAEKETRGWFLFKGNIEVDGLSFVRAIPGRHDSYGVWSRRTRVVDEPGFEALLAAILGVEAVLGHDLNLYSASSDGRTTHIAIRNRRDLFRLGGLFSTRGNLEGQIRGAHSDLLMPIKVVQVLLDAEAKTLAESRESAPETGDNSPA